MNTIQCSNQQELEAALKAGNYPVLIGSEYFEVSGSAQVRAYGSAQVTAFGSAQVTAYDSAQVRAFDSAQVTAYDSAQVRAFDSAQVTAFGSAQVRAYGSAQVTASDSAQVTAFGSAQVRASQYVAVTRHGDSALVDGGVLIQLPELSTAVEWCEFYGVVVTDGIATLYKGVSDDYKTSQRGFEYRPGSTPQAPDWDGGVRECGGGLHFSPTPIHTLRFEPEAKHFIACPVRLSDIAVHPRGQYPEKCKAPGLCAPCYEVDIDGVRVQPLDQKG